MAVPTGLWDLDRCLRGGIPDCAVTEIRGGPGSGKTQLLMQAAARASRSGQVLYVDTTGKFRPERAAQMGGDLSRITVYRATNSSEQAGALDGADRFAMIAVDSASDLFAYEYGPKGRSRSGGLAFHRYMRSLAGAALSAGIPAVVTATPRGMRDGMDDVAALHAHVRIYLARVSPQGVKKPRFRGSARWALGGTAFGYLIGGGGLESQDI
ncbi:MAG: hypothetical protein MPJ05_01645 [Nitrosopumilus sp.]|nr:hypothetical protein [Nitrosopumilus sp.]MDA7952515.1 hypothetical protein [Nitrosopumilus sp.]